MAATNTTKKPRLEFPVIYEGAEHMAMGHLMRRNILTYKAPPLNEGYDLICIHPDPRHRPKKGEKTQVRVQVKSRYSTDCDRTVPVKQDSLNAFDFLIIVFLNIGNFQRGRDGSEGAEVTEFYTLTRQFARYHHNGKILWGKVTLAGMDKKFRRYKNEDGFELIAQKLGIPKATR